MWNGHDLRDSFGSHSYSYSHPFHFVPSPNSVDDGNRYKIAFLAGSFRSGGTSEHGQRNEHFEQEEIGLILATGRFDVLNEQNSSSYFIFNFENLQLIPFLKAWNADTLFIWMNPKSQYQFTFPFQFQFFILLLSLFHHFSNSLWQQLHNAQDQRTCFWLWFWYLVLVRSIQM